MMFYILVLLGISLIIMGIMKDKKEEPDSDLGIEIEDLKLRIENLEKEFYRGKTTSFHDIAISTYKDISLSSLDNYRKVLEYEEKNYSIEEISKKLHMKKGELLLLKNLYKEYQD